MRRLASIFLLLALSNSSSFAQTAVLLPAPKLQFLNASGVPLSGGCVQSYAAGTSTPQATFTDSTGGTSNANPVILDSAGRASIFLTQGIQYKFVVTSTGGSNCSTGTLQYTQDNVALGATLTVGGSNTQVQYNSSGALAGSSNFTWNNATQTLSIGALVTTSGGTLAGTFTGNPTFSGNPSFTGLPTVKTLNSVQFADQYSGDFCQKLSAAATAAGTGGTVNALGLQGAQLCGANTTLSVSNVSYLLPANVTITATIGITITISGSDVNFIGAGDTTLFDFSSGTSANDNFHVSGSRVRIERIKILGNRVAGGTATCVSFFSSLTTFWIENATFTNCGGQGVYAYGFSDGHIARSRFTSSRTGGIFIDTGSSDLWVSENSFSGTNTSNTGGQGGLSVNGNTSTFDSGFHILLNKFVNTTGVAIQVNSVSAAVGRITRNAEAIGNTIDTTLTSGEGISFTANNYRIIGNRVTNTCVTGILVYGVPSGVDSSVVISDNIISDASKCVSGNNYGIQLAYGAASLAKMRITDNLIFDDQGGSATTAGAVNFNNAGGAGTIADAIVSGNISRGNISAVAVSFSQIADAANVIQFGNSPNASGNTFLVRNPQVIGGISTAAPPTENTGFQHKRATGCTTGATSGNNCETTVTWTNAFADTNYTVSCTLLGPATLGHLAAISTSAVAAGTVKVQTVTDTNAAITGTVNCIAVHD